MYGHDYDAPNPGLVQDGAEPGWQPGAEWTLLWIENTDPAPLTGANKSGLIM
ncbi:hypothetical protein [Streptomyces sp. Root369]|uniref:hypothetical protein n=1 Tax=Streptomyces sp. Root369 TaxID=1736523 RepID=UPI001300FF7D|nr:hypothetical protein [Streptomyces sp. Root369]